MRASKTTHGLRTKEMLELGRAIRRLNAMTEKV
jgi:hypothetical protein